MATRVRYTRCVFLLLFLSVFGVSSAGKSDVGARESTGLEIKCEEVKVRITVKRQFFEERRIPFKPEYLRLGANSTLHRSCRPKGPVSEPEMVISAGLHECGTESSVREGGLTRESLDI